MSKDIGKNGNLQNPSGTSDVSLDEEIHDFRGLISKRVEDEINVSLAIENEDARSAGKLGFMARALVQATMPYKDPKSGEFSRTNGDLVLRIISTVGTGVPYGIYPRLLMSWLTTEAVKTQSPHIVLGESLGIFMRSLDLKRGSANARFIEQMYRLFGSMVSVHRKASKGRQGFSLRNLTIVDEVEVTDEDASTFWEPQEQKSAGRWKSSLLLSGRFYKEITDSPVPIDLRAFVALGSSPLAMDVYAWLTFRYSYLRAETKPIPWALLQMQFGSGFSMDSQGHRNFKKQFVLALQSVLRIYPSAKFTTSDRGLVLYPSPPHIAKDYAQKKLW